MYSYIQYIQSLRLEHEQNPLLVIHQEACRKIVKQKIIEIFAAFLANFVNAGIYIFFRILHIQTYILPKMQVTISKVCNIFEIYFQKFVWCCNCHISAELLFHSGKDFFFFFRLLDRFSLLFTYNMKMGPYFHSINFWCGPSLLSKWSITYILLNFTTFY